MPGTRVISMDEVEQHNSSESIWMVIHNGVYDVTKFLNEHPGGEEALLDYAGMEASVPFDEVGHSNDAKELMKKYKIGDLQASKKDCKLCDILKKYAPYGVAALAASVVLGFIILRSQSK